VTISSAGADYGPQSLLADNRRFARQVRNAQRATWFPLLVFAAVTFAAVPVYRLGPRGMTCRPVPAAGPGGRVCSVYSTAAFVYWPIALVLAYAVIAAFYVRRARSRGVGTRVYPYAVAGVGLALLLSGVAVWRALHPLTGAVGVLGLQLGPGGYPLFSLLVSPATAIGLALLVLAFVERNRPLVAVAVGYLVVAYLVVGVWPPSALGWIIRGPSLWSFLPQLVIDGVVLLVAGLAFARAQRAPQRGAHQGPRQDDE
jgi:hypothetical protein